MGFFTKLLASRFDHARLASRPTLNRRVRLHLETLEDRCVPSGSPLTLASNHELMYGSTVVLKKSSCTNGHPAPTWALPFSKADSSRITQGRRRPRSMP
jgi:hypothetical protein